MWNWTRNETPARRSAAAVIGAVLCCLLLSAAPVAAREYALVIGIDDYPADPVKLRGAVNDARLLSRVLSRRLGADPVHRLLGPEATYAAVRSAWRSLAARAGQGDRIWLSFAGHGLQIADRPPLDEQGISSSDGVDEALMLYDYRPGGAQGLLSDDELYRWLQQTEAEVIVVLDTCFSGGMMRRPALDGGWPVRNGRDSLHRQAAPAPRDLPEIARPLPHVIYLMAQGNESESVTEYAFGGTEQDAPVAHGALSYYLAQALQGASGGSTPGRDLTYGALARYLFRQVSRKTAYSQKPLSRFPPGFDRGRVLVRLARAPAPAAADLRPLRVFFAGALGRQAPRFDGVVATAEDQNPQLRVQPGRDGRIDFYNARGGRVLSRPLQAFPPAEWQAVFDKYRLIQALAQQRPATEDDPRIELPEGEGLYRVGQSVPVRVTDDGPDPVYPVLINLGPAGEISLLWPRRQWQQRARPLQFASPQGKWFRFKAEPPVGEERVLAFFCQRPSDDLLDALQVVRDASGRLRRACDAGTTDCDRPGQRLIDALDRARCRYADHAVFTTDDRND